MQVVELARRKTTPKDEQSHLELLLRPGTWQVRRASPGGDVFAAPEPLFAFTYPQALDWLPLGCAATRGWPAVLEIHLFGHFELVRDGQEIAAEVWPQRKTLQLFKLLLREPGKACSQEELATLLWPEVERKRALSSLHSRLSELRRVLEPTSGENGRSSYILRRGRPATYAFSAKSACWLDTLEFARRICEAEAHLQEGQLARALEIYRAALDLYREDFLSEDRLESWSFEPRERYRRQVVEAVRSYAACLIKSERYDQALSVYQRGLRIAPGDEQLYRLLMRVCLLSGGADAA
ncbi:MAG TPA: hypothetical protein ENI60_01920, partial [Candidatus Fraserbacteria bacterium]|nr:hypothetical protein [Candidatus Fraserbacteria bacterium]